MRSLFLFSWLILNVLVGNGAASAAFANDLVEDAGRPAGEPLPLIETYDLEALDPTPQYPVALNDFDGTTYWYNTDCCDNDGHVGIYLSPDEIMPLGCGVADPIEMYTEPLMRFSGPGLPNQMFDFSIALSPRFATEPQAAVFNPLEPGQTTIRDFYGSAKPLNTAVRLKAADGQTRYFSLVRYRQAGTWTNASGQPENYVHEFLVLLRPRKTASFQQQATGEIPDGLSLVEVVLPTNQIHPDGFSVTNIDDWGSGFAKVATIRLPPSTGARMQDVKVLVFNRVLP